MMRGATMQCQKDTSKTQWEMTADVLDETTLEFVLERLPWAVRRMPERYPWLYGPDIFEKERRLRACMCHEQDCDGIHDIVF